MKNVNQKIEISKEKLVELKQELKNLYVERELIVVELAEARAQGDLSENAEYDAARDKQGEIVSRISELQYIIDYHTIVKHNSNSKIVRLGSIVEVSSKTNKSVNGKYTIVGSLESNPLEKKISNISPLAVAIVGQKVGDIVEVKTTKFFKVKVESIN
ncbi:MAG: transcription elongation factor GreA [Mollicutes bacterium PWAP]|nr:transcription elongation factor GreA [Mollicutes bacterium PWAP]